MQAKKSCKYLKCIVLFLFYAFLFLLVSDFILAYSCLFFLFVDFILGEFFFDFFIVISFIRSNFVLTKE